MKWDVFTAMMPFPPELLEDPGWDSIRTVMLEDVAEQCREAGGTPMEDASIEIIDVPPSSFENANGEEIEIPAQKGLLVRIPCVREVTK